MRAVDAWAIKDRGVPSLELMETAGRAVAVAAAEAASSKRAVVVCGKGNNGGDGLVAARALAETGFEVETLLLWQSDELSEDAKANLGSLQNARHVEPAEVAGAVQSAGVVVDAIFGTGFSGEPRDPAAAAMDALNGCPCPIVAADIASGVNASSGVVEGAAVEADVTVTFHAPKVGHWISPGKRHTGELRVVPIGIPDGGPMGAAAGLIDSAVLEMQPRRGAESTKFSSGQVVIVGASRGLTGAVCLSASAAIRSGAGYATVAVPAELEQVFEVKLTEVMSVGCASREGRLRRAASEQIMNATEGAAAVVLGPGIGREDGTKDLVRDLAQRIEAPLVIDADGLNAHAGRIKKLRDRSHPTVLTPHAGEFERLFGMKPPKAAFGRARLAKTLSRSYDVVLVLKDARTLTISDTPTKSRSRPHLLLLPSYVLLALLFVAPLLVLVVFSFAERDTYGGMAGAAIVLMGPPLCSSGSRRSAAPAASWLRRPGEPGG